MGDESAETGDLGVGKGAVGEGDGVDFKFFLGQGSFEGAGKSEVREGGRVGG